MQIVVCPTPPQFFTQPLQRKKEAQETIEPVANREFLKRPILKHAVAATAQRTQISQIARSYDVIVAWRL